MFNFIRALCVILFFGLLAACGGGGSGATISPPVVIVPPTTPPSPPAPQPPPPPTMTPTTTTIALPAPRSPNTVNWRDNEFRVNYGLDRIGADVAYRHNYLGLSATVAVVDTGVRSSHDSFEGAVVLGGQPRNVDNLLSGAARRFDRNGRAITDSSAHQDRGNHGTGVAAVIAGTFTSDPELGHGVAPLAKILPLRFSDTQLTTINRLQGPVSTYPLVGDTRAAFRYAAITQNVHIINNSWGSGFDYYGHYGGDRSATIAFTGPVLPQAMQFPAIGSFFRNRMSEYANIFRNRDIAVVWAAGNDGWNSETGGIDTYEVPGYQRFYLTPRPGNTYTPQQLVSNFVAFDAAVNGGPTMSLNLNRGTTLVINGAPVTIGGLEPNGFGDYALAPLYHPELRGRWLAVVATDENNRIASFSNGCGSIGKQWCLAAPGVRITNASAGGDDYITSWNGTSFSAPHVSGALALLKSRLPGMPMSVLVHILLTTATDLGAPGVDDVYGHGLVNVADAIVLQGNIRLPSYSSSQGVLLQNANINLPPMLDGLARGLRNESIAVQYLPNHYYDHSLAGFVGVDDAPPLYLDSGDIWHWRESDYEDGRFFAAHDDGGRLRNAGMRLGRLEFRHSQHSAPSALAGGNTMLPFFVNQSGEDVQMRYRFGGGFSGFAANGDSYRQGGVLFNHNFGRFGFRSSFSRIDEDGTLLGGKLGGVAPLVGGGESLQARARMSFAVGDSWQLFAAAEQAKTKAKTGGIIGRIDGLRAFGWQAGAAAEDIFRYGDKLRLALTQETAITGGTAILHLHQSTAGGWQITERAIPLASNKKHRTIAAGYGLRVSDNERWSLAAAYRIDDEARLHLQWRAEW